MKKKLKLLIILILAILLSYTVFYLTECHQAQTPATECLNGTENVSVVKIDNGLLLDGFGNDTSIIFYPGAKNEYISYLPMLMNLANHGIDCYVLQVPLNFAVFGENEADSIINAGNYSHYFIAGHSLGGLTASSYLNHTGKGDGVILFAGYPVEEIRKPVLSIYGTDDGILNMKAYNESKSLMDNLTEVVIEGGNHAQFAYYGHQDGDNVARISAEDQQQQAVDEILNFINQF